MTLRDWKAGHLVVAKDVVVLDLFGHHHGVGNGRLHHVRFEVIGKETAHLLLGLDVFRAGVSQPFLIADQLAGENAEQGVMGLHIVLAEVMGIVGGHQLNAKVLGNADDLHIDDAVLR